MRRIATILIVALAATACGSSLYQTDDFSASAAGDSVVFWRMAAGPSGYVGVGGPIQTDDLAEDAGPLSLSAYHSPDGSTWQPTGQFGSIETPLLGLTAWEGGYAASGVWDGVPGLFISPDGVNWDRYDLPLPDWFPPSATVGIESAGIAASAQTVVISGFVGEPASPLLWALTPGEEPLLVDADAFGDGARINQVVAGPAGFVASVSAMTPQETPPPIWLSADGATWDPVLGPFGDGTVVTGLIGSAAGYVAIAADADDEATYTLWTSANGIDWRARADQETVFEHLIGTGGDLYGDLLADPREASETRPIAFAFSGHWIEVLELYEGQRFITVCVAADGATRIVSGFSGNDDPTPWVLLAGY